GTLRVRNLSAYHGELPAIRDVSLTIRPRSVTALIGPSGCGKSTLLRTLNRMHETVPGARVTGTVLLDDQDVYGPDIDPVRLRRVVGMVFGRPNPFPTMSVFDNVAVGLRLAGRGRPGRRDRSRGRRSGSGSGLDAAVERALRQAHLWTEVADRLDRPAVSLSGGQQQRLCIARALAVQPSVLLMDEPCSGLDPASTLAIEDLVTELKERCTLVLVTHDLGQAARVSDSTAFLAAPAVGQPGRLVEYGETGALFRNPTDPRTEAFLTGRYL
ncbi:MAG TPA: phosphate ABC transporter ATP-binding protein, partial [Mycobacteriales bacterium]